MDELNLHPTSLPAPKSLVGMRKETDIAGKVWFLVIYDGLTKKAFTEQQYPEALAEYNLYKLNESKGLPKVEIINPDTDYPL